MGRYFYRIMLVLFTAILLSVGAFAADTLVAPTDTITVGELLTVSVRLYAANNGESTAALPDGSDGDYSDVAAYAQAKGLIDADSYSSYGAAATRLDAVRLLYPTLPSNAYTAINEHITAVPGLSEANAYYDEVLTFYRAGIVSGGVFLPNYPLTVSEAQRMAERLAVPEKRLLLEEQPAVTQKQAYRLAITSSMDAYKEGIQSGWEVDNRAGNLRTSLGGNTVLSDIMTDEKSRMIRHFNRITGDTVEIRARLSYSFGFDGNVIELCDSDDSPTYRLVNAGGAFCIQNADGTLTPLFAPQKTLTAFNFRIIVDLETGMGTTSINNVCYGEYPLLGNAIKYLAFSTSDSSTNITTIGASYAFANYAVYETLDLTTGIPYDMQTVGTVTNTSGEFVLSPASSLTRSFAARTDPTVFSLNAYLPNGTGGVSFALRSGNDDIVRFTAANGKLYANGVELKSFTDKLWYKLRVEANPYTQTADIKVNSKVLATVPFLTQTVTFDGIALTNTGNTTVKADDLMVYSLIDYDVPEPVIPAGEDDYVIGLNVCSLWVNGDHWGWACVTPYADLRPVLGYYDEGIPEVADWENKFMAEHGIDFQAFCWYANQSNAPMKSTRLSDQLDLAYLNSKYSDKVKFCLLWEAANAARPANSEAFRNYFVPYWIENYFSDPRYMSVDNKLVFSIFGADQLISVFGTSLKDEFDYMREEVKKLGYDGMIITASHTGRKDLAQYGFDAWQAYNWGSSGYSYTTNVNSNLSAHNNKDVYVIPTVSVGFNHVAWAGTRYPLMSVADYEKTHKWVRDVYLPTYSNANDWTHNFLWLSTWNEYGEGTYIMPANDLNGFGYLDVLRSVYTTAPSEHTDAVPTEEQKTHFNHLYPQDRRLLRAYGNYTPPSDDYDDSPRVLDFTVAGNYANYITLSNMGGVVGTTSKGTTFRSHATNPDAIFGIKSAAFAGYTCDQIECIRVTASGIPAGQNMQLFYQTDGAPALSETNSIRVASTTTAETTFVFNVSAANGWRGNIRSLRLDPLQVTNTEFTVKSIEIIPKAHVVRPDLYINDYKVENVILPEIDSNGVWYYPFEPGKSVIHYLLYTYYEWDYDTQVLKLYRDGKCVTFTVGSASCDVNGTPFALDGAVYSVDNIPMLPLESLAEVLGFEWEKKGSDYYFTTPESALFAETLANNLSGEWNFNILGSTCGWQRDNTDISYGDGTIILISDNNDPRFKSPSGLNLDCSTYKKIEIRCRWNNTGGSGYNMGFYFITAADPNWTQSKSLHATRSASSNGEFVTFVYDMSANSAWTGTLQQIRFDPFDAPGTIEIDYIKLTP